MSDSQPRPPHMIHQLGRELVFLVAPPVFAAVTALSGLIVLAALMIPGQVSRVPFDLPLPLLEASHFVSSIVGTALLILSLGIRQRLHSAWVMALVAFILLAGLSLVAGRDVLLAIALGVAALGLFAARPAFYRSGALSRIWLSPQRLSILILMLAGLAWLGFFAYRNVAYRDDLWWTFALDSDVSRFFRALVVMSVTMVLFFFWRLLQPPAAPPPAGNDASAGGAHCRRDERRRDPAAGGSPRLAVGQAVRILGGWAGLHHVRRAGSELDHNGPAHGTGRRQPHARLCDETQGGPRECQSCLLRGADRLPARGARSRPCGAQDWRDGHSAA
tara:strand:+ start:44722 stop:45717 length:996 start_codon:yes stop_codon:yes gene_type:complete